MSSDGGNVALAFHVATGLPKDHPDLLAAAQRVLDHFHLEVLSLKQVHTMPREDDHGDALHELP